MPKKKISISTLIREDIKRREASIKERLAILEKDREFIFPRIPSKLTYKVSLTSHWEDEGEKSVEIQGTQPLEQIILTAIRQFKEVNQRSNVAANWYVYIILPSGTHINIPEEIWGHMKD